MASITATSSVICSSLLPARRFSRVSSSSVLGLPAIGKKGRVRCSMEEKPSVAAAATGGTSLIAAVAATAMSSPAAMALVDERMSTEGTGLPFGLSNNTLGWILFGVFGLIWTLYFTYTSTLEEDEESGLSL